MIQGTAAGCFSPPATQTRPYSYFTSSYNFVECITHKYINYIVLLSSIFVGLPLRPQPESESIAGGSFRKSRTLPRPL